MGQYFLLSAAARTLSLSAVARMSDEEAGATFQRIRWADNGGEPYCPQCGCVSVKKLGTRPVWKCRACSHQFSVTSGTLFADRKRPVRDYLLAIAIFANGAKGHSALQLSRDLNCQYRTAFVLAHKLREAIKAEQDSVTLSGTVETDGAYFSKRARIDLEEIKPTPLPPRFPAYKGEIARIVLTALRQTTAPMTTRDLTTLVMTERGLNMRDRKLLGPMAKRTGACLEQYRNRGLIKSERHAGNVVTWEIVR